MTALMRGELIKAATTRTWLAYTALGVVLAAATVIIGSLSTDVVRVSDKQGVISGWPIVLLLFGLVGAAGEYRHRTAAPAALVAGRDRGVLLLARMGAYALAGLALAALMTAVSLALGLPLLSGEPGPSLGAGDVVGVAGGSLVAAALSAIMGVAVGALLRNQVAGVVSALILAFVVTPLLTTISETAQEYTPIGAAVVLAGALDGEALSWSAAALLLAAWTVALVAVAIVAERRRDLA